MDRLTDKLPADQPDRFAQLPQANRPTEESAHDVSTPAEHSADALSETLLESRIDPEVEAIITKYFETFNAGDFAETAALFAEEGAMFPPFESAVVGPEAIAAYLRQEAQGMKIEVRQCVQETLETGITEVKVAGKVQTPLFGVNVTWMFGLNDRLELLAVRIKLLAALEDLLKLKQ
ncbi:YybH family protein [Leptolyngbya ohadii]|uniref:YybH family protein n=1 Tax=Leptolyngbya ohadii TaxID=1962290 RepID=UPI000B59A420|nr:ketosteroid isomerase family protein [Leptolyngbya ohadii]